MSSENVEPAGQSEEDAMAAEWAAALAETKPESGMNSAVTEQVSPASFTNFTPTSNNPVVVVPRPLSTLPLVTPAQPATITTMP